MQGRLHLPSLDSWQGQTEILSLNVRNSSRLGEQQLGGKVGASHRTPQKVEAREPMPHPGYRDKFGEAPTKG